jgi:hypothetical protein
MLSSGTLIKFLNEKHRSVHFFQYKLGLNEDSVKFNPSRSCAPGGLYYTDIKNGHNWFHYGDVVAIIQIPNNAQVYNNPCNTKFKADKFIITEFVSISKQYSRK